MSEDKIPMIFSAICGVMEDIGAIGKGSTNKQQGYRYRGVDDVMNALNPAMMKHKIFCIPEVLEQSREERTTTKGTGLVYSVCRIRYRFYATDGSYVDAVVVGEGMDSGDKASNKAMAAAFKYACFQTFCIPTENLMDDPDATSPVPSKKEGAPADTGKAKQAGTARGNPNPAKKELLDELYRELGRAGYSMNSVFKKYGVIQEEELTVLMLKDCISKMKSLPDKKDRGVA